MPTPKQATKIGILHFQLGRILKTSKTNSNIPKTPKKISISKGIISICVGNRMTPPKITSKTDNGGLMIPQMFSMFSFLNERRTPQAPCLLYTFSQNGDNLTIYGNQSLAEKTITKQLEIIPHCK